MRTPIHAQLILALFVPTSTATVLTPYFQQVNSLVAAHAASVGRLNAAATMTGQMLVVGGSFFLTPNNNQEAAFFYEASGRSGGLMLTYEYPEPSAIHAGDVLWVSYSRGSYQSTVSLVATIEQAGAKAVVFGPQPPSGPPPFTYWVDSLTPWQSSDDFTLLGNVLSLWSMTGELAGATARLGKTLVFWESISVPGSSERNAKYMGTLFHTSDPGQPQMAPVAAGVLSAKYLSYVTSMLGRIETSESTILATGQFMSARAAAGNPVTFVTLSHLVNFVPTLAGNPLFNFVRTVTSTLNDTLKTSGFLLDIGYAGVDDALWQDVRAAPGAKAAWIVAPSPYQSSPTQSDFTHYGDTFLNQQWDFGDCTVPVSGYDVCILPASGIAQLFVYESLLISGNYYNDPITKPFVTVQSFGAPNSGYTGWLGMQFTVGSSPITVTSLGRAYFIGNSATHTLKLVRARDGVDLPGGSVSLALQSGTSQQFQYAALPNPVVLSANTSYFMVTQETAAGDEWRDNNQSSTTNAGTMNGAVYTVQSGYAPQPIPNIELGPVNFLYTDSSALPPAVSILEPAAEATVSGTTVQMTATATAATGLSISSVRFYVDGNPIATVANQTGPFNAVLDSTALSNGSHVLTAVASDTGGMQSSSLPVSVVVTNPVAPPAVPNWTVKIAHTGSFVRSQTGAAYTITVSNTGTGPTNGVVTVDDSVPTGLVLTSIYGAGWSCTRNICSRADSLALGLAYPPLTLTIDVALNAPPLVTNQVIVSGGGAASVTAADPTNILSSGPPFGFVDTPADHLTGITGAISLTGWALSYAGIQTVAFWRDPLGSESAGSSGLVFLAEAAIVPGSRPDVAAKYPGYPGGGDGWGGQILTNTLPGSSQLGGLGNGTYRVHVIGTDSAGHSTDVGVRSFTVDNAHAVIPFGTIDTPAQGETISGTNYLNFGWALTPASANFIPKDGSTIWVFIDGRPVGHPVYNNYRSDVANLFPELRNSSGAVGYFVIDTTKLTNGIHQISWSVSDNSGNRQGVGARFFFVKN